LFTDPYFETDNRKSNSSTNTSTAGYLRNLASLRSVSLKHGIPFWNFFNTLAYSSHYDPSEGMVRWQAFSSLAYGAKGVLYFMYWPARDPSLALGGSIITARQAAVDDPPNRSSTLEATANRQLGSEAIHSALQKNIDTIAGVGSTDHGGGAGAGAPAVQYVKGPHYAHAARTNAVLKVFGSFLLHATSTALHHGEALRNETVRISNPASVFAAVNNTGAGAVYSFLIGLFSLPDGRAAFLLQNQDYNAGLWATVELRGGVGALSEVDPVSGDETGLMDDSPFQPGLQLSLESGAARLFVTKANAEL
jgi:hypothetical protein